MPDPLDAPMLPADVALIPVPTPFEIGNVNSYLLKGDPLTLVDPGPLTDDAWQALQAGLNDHGTRPEDIELILLTHQHEDHVGLAHAVADASGAPIAGLPELAGLLRDYDASMEIEDRYMEVTMLSHGVDDQSAASLMRMFRWFRSFVRSVEVGEVIDEGTPVLAGGRELKVLRAPGHSPTDTLFFSEADGVLIGGDHLLQRISSNPIAHWPIDGRDPEISATAPDRRRPLIEYITSIKRTAELEVSLVLPGHGSPFSDHRQLIDRRIAMHEKRARTILDTIDGATTAADVGRRLWNKAPSSEGYLVLSEVLGHLDLLEQSGDVQQLQDAGRVHWETVGQRAR